jgi:hypothetical protein
VVLGNGAEKNWQNTEFYSQVPRVPDCLALLFVFALLELFHRGGWLLVLSCAGRSNNNRLGGCPFSEEMTNTTLSTIGQNHQTKLVHSTYPTSAATASPTVDAIGAAMLSGCDLTKIEFKLLINDALGVLSSVA